MNHDSQRDGERSDSPQASPPPAPTDVSLDHDQEARDWLANVYQGDTVRQLSVRSIVTGMLIGGVMSISNLYVGLKTGWGLGVTITACVIAYAVFDVLQKVVPAYRSNHFTILENYTMSSAASAAGYMASAGLVSAIPALQLTTGREMESWEMMAWLAAVSILGVFLAVPLKRQLINIDKLPFPSGIATAETLKSMHSSGVEALSKARVLLWTAVAGATLGLWKDGLREYAHWLGKCFKDPEVEAGLARAAFPEEFPLFPHGRVLLDKLTIGFEGSMIMIAAGAIMGMRVGVSLLVGAVFYYGILAPILMSQGIVNPSGGYRNIVNWTLWPATSMMVASGLLAFGLKWRTISRSLSGLTKLFGSKGDRADPLAAVEVPGSWFLVGALLSGAACVLLGHWRFEITWWMGILAVAITFVLSIVAARATGETDITPIGAMGKITQLTYGVIAPSSITTNLMTASITAGAASHAADLLTDLKSGYLLGGNPRQQTISQLFGVLAGTLFCVPIYAIVATPDRLFTSAMPAPSAKVWASVAELMKGGIQNLPVSARWGMLVGAIVGIAITLLEEYLPKEDRKFIPSATGLGIAGVIPAFNSISMFLGALIAWQCAKRWPIAAERYTVTASSGLIAGESLMAVSVRLVANAPEVLGAVYDKMYLAWLRIVERLFYSG